jgi:hypothetical protein
MADYDGMGNTYVPYQGGYTIEEFIDFIQNELTISCALPKTFVIRLTVPPNPGLMPDSPLMSITTTLSPTFNSGFNKLIFFFNNKYILSIYC